MPKVKKITSKRPLQRTKTVEQKVVSTNSKTRTRNSGFLERLQTDLESNKSYLNIILGALVIVILGVLVYNFFSKNNNPQITGDLGPAQQTTNIQNVTPLADVSIDQLPGNYTVKDKDTLFLIAQKYYGDGYKYSKLVEVNKIGDENNITVGQVLQIPKLDQAVAYASPAPSAQPAADQAMSPQTSNTGYGTGGAVNQTIWGEKIDGETYTVQTGDWLSKIAGRAYGDVMLYTKIAQANNITDPNLIEPGTVLKIPRS
jgi:nucleoid-associated protein YgaU